MATKASKALFIALISLHLVSSALALSTGGEEEERRREVEQCKQVCRQQPHYDQGMRRRCESSCDERKQREERGGGGDVDESFNSHRRDPEQRLEQCKERCREQQGQPQRWQCERQCQQEYEEERRREQGRDETPEYQYEELKRDGGRQEEAERRFEQCKDQCRRQGGEGEPQRWACQQQCRQKYEEERGSRQERRDSSREDPQRKLEECKRDCRQSHQGRQQQSLCQQQCQQRYEEEQRSRQEQDGSIRDPPTPARVRLEKCRQECRDRHQGEQQEQLQCQGRCLQRYEEERRQEEGQWPDDETRQDPQERLEECRRRCRKEGGQQHQARCEQDCERKYREEQQRQQGRDGGRGDINPQREQEEEQEEETTGRANPYVFQRESFRHYVRSEHGNFRILQNFAQKSKLLLGIANYRIATLEVDPNTFVVPRHCDSDILLYVTEGEGTITVIKGDRDRETHNIRQGDIFKISAGTIAYMINKSNSQRLKIAKILNPVFTPGQFQEFYTVGGQRPESYHGAFSTEILEAALNIRRDQWERLFGHQDKGVMIEASQEQIREMSRHGGHWTFGGEQRGPYNLLNKRPAHANQHGRHYEVDRNDYPPLRDLDMQVSFANITGGSMVAPFFNSRATKISIVTGGRGYIEIVCPHSGQQQGGKGQWGEQQEEQEQKEGQQRQGRRYQKVRARVTEKTVFIVPPGHPVAIVAEQDQNLEVLCFEVNAENNSKTFVAGRNNVVSKMERQAKELAFGVPSKLVDEVFSRQQEEMFVRGPQSQQPREREREEEEGRRQPLNSILEFAAGF